MPTKAVTYGTQLLTRNPQSFHNYHFLRNIFNIFLRKWFFNLELEEVE